MKRLIFLVALTFFVLGSQAGLTETMSLDGTWEIEPGTATEPAGWNYNVSVPGVVDMAGPAMDWKGYDYFWYKRTFTLSPSDQRGHAFIKINKAQFGTEVWLNGVSIGSYIGCFTSHEYNADTAINYSGENTLLVRVGSRNTLSADSVFGQDWEKEHYIPGIIDNVSLILMGDVRVENVLMIPHIDTDTAEAKIILTNLESQAETITLSTQVFEKVSGTESSSLIENTYDLTANEKREVIVNIPLSGVQLWSPDNPFLYELEAKIIKAAEEIDNRKITFGMREFKIVDDDFYLNGNKIFLKGSSIAFYRLLDDPERGSLPWNYDWIKQALVDMPKEYNMNYFRVHVGPMYSKWYDLADEHGILLEDEWALWGKVEGTEAEIVAEFTQWMYDNGNHPSVIWYSAINEPRLDDIDALPMINYLHETVVPQMKAIDPSRPWGWVDFIVRHHHIYSFHAVLGYEGLMDEIESETTPKVINESQWFWLDKNGEPTFITRDVVGRWVEEGATSAELLDFQAFIAVEITELFRRMEIDVMAPFVYISSNSGVTANWFASDLATLAPKPILPALKNAFAPFGVSLELWDRHFTSGEVKEINVYVFNDHSTAKSGTLYCKIVDEDDIEIANMGSFPVTVPAGDTLIQAVTWTMPSLTGTYYLKTELTPEGETTPVAESKKIAHVLNEPAVPGNLTGANIMVYDVDDEIINYLTPLGLSVSGYSSAALNSQDILILGEGALTDGYYDSRRNEITQFVENGHSLIVIEPGFGNPGSKRELEVLDGISVVVDSTWYGNHSYVFAADDSFPLWNGIDKEHLKFFNGGYGGEIVSAYDAVPQQQVLSQVKCGRDLKISAVMEGIAGDGVLIYSRIQVRGRLTEEADPGTDLYSRRADVVAQQYLLNAISTYLDTAANRQRIGEALKTMPLFVKRAMASSVEQDSFYFPPDKAIDKSMNSRWSSRSGNPQWIKLDLGSDQKFNRVELSWKDSAFAKSYQIQVSSDGNNWTNVYSTTSGDGGTDEITFSTVAGRYVRMHGTELGANCSVYSLYEIEVSYDCDETLGSVDFGQTSYTSTEGEAIITVVDADLNTGPLSQQTVDVSITSATDPIGITMTLTEISDDSDTFTSEATGINLKFSETISNDTTETIKTSEADFVTAAYNDISPVGTQTTAIIWYTGRNSDDLALARETTAFSYQNAAYAPCRATDENNNTRWSSEFSDPQWLQVDLGSQRSINKVILDWELGYGKSYKIEVSGNGIDWAEVYATTSGDGYIDEISFTSVTARFIRMYGTKRATPFGYSLWEFKVFGDVSIGEYFNINGYPNIVYWNEAAEVDVGWTNIDDSAYKLVVELEKDDIVHVQKEITQFSSTEVRTVKVGIANTIPVGAGYNFKAAFVEIASGGDYLTDETPADVKVMQGHPALNMDSYPTTVERGGTADVDVTWSNAPTDGSYKLIVQLENWDATPAVYVSTEIISFASSGTQTITLDIPGDATISAGGRFVAAFISTATGWDDVLTVYYGDYDVEVTQGSYPLVNIDTYPTTVERGGTADVDVTWSNAPIDGSYKLIVKLENWDASPAINIEKEITSFASSDTQTITLDIPGDATISAGGRFVAAFISTATGWDDVLTVYYGDYDVEVIQGSYPLVNIDSYPTTVERGGTADVDVTWSNAPIDGSYKLIVKLENWDASPAINIEKEITSFASSDTQTITLDIPGDTTISAGGRFVAAFISTATGWDDVLTVYYGDYDVEVTQGSYPLVNIDSYPTTVEQLTTADVNLSWSNVPVDGSYKLILKLENWDVIPVVNIEKEITSFAASDTQTVTLDIPGDATISAGGRFVAAFISTTTGWDDVLTVCYGDYSVEIIEGIVPSVTINSYPTTVYTGQTADVNVTWSNVPTDGSCKLIVQLENWDVTPSVHVSTEIISFAADDTQTITMDIPGDATISTGGRFVAAFISTTTGWDDVLTVYYGPGDVEVARSMQGDIIAYHVAGEIVIDGVLDELDWETANYVEFMNSSNADAGVYKGYVLWDEDYLYFAGTATDQHLETSQFDWNDDGFACSVNVEGGVLSKNRVDIGGTGEGSGAGGADINIVNAIASSIEGAGFESIKAIDGNIATRWASQPGSDNEWIYIDLGSIQAFDRVILYWEDAYADKYEIQISDDAASWAPIYTEPAGGGGTEVINVDGQSARYVKMQGVSRATAYGYSLWEIEVFKSFSAFTCNGTIDNNLDTDTAWIVEMKIPWSSSGPAPSLNDLVQTDFVAVDHDNNPGGAWDDPATEFCRISWDGDNNPDTASKNIFLSELSIVIDNFDDADPSMNALGFDTGDDGTCAVSEDIGGEHKLSWDNIGDYWYSLLWDGATYLAGSGTDCLSLEIRGYSGKEELYVELEDDIGSQSLSISDYVSIYVLPQRVDIPLRDFTTLDSTKLKNLKLDFSAQSAGTIFIDNIQIFNIGPLLCSVEYTNPSFIRSDGLPVYFMGDTVNYTVHIRNVSDSAVDGFEVTAIHEYYESTESHGKGDPLPGTSTEVWTSQTIAAGGSLDLYDSYLIPAETDAGFDRTHVTIKDSYGSTLYDKPECGLWCPPPFVKASSIEGAGFEADKAIDCDLDTRWESKWTESEWIYIDYGEPKSFNTIVLTWEAAYGRQYEIQTSDDGLIWTTIYTEASGDGDVDTISVGNQTARFVKMQGVQRATTYGYSLWEFEVENNILLQGEIAGNVTIQGRTDHAELITFELRNHGETTPIETFQISTGGDGSYTLSQIDVGIYDLTAKSSNTLRAKQENVVVTAGGVTTNMDFALLGGDADGDNKVFWPDYGILSSAWGSQEGEGNWDERADFDGDGKIFWPDYGVLSGNWMQSGVE